MQEKGDAMSSYRTFRIDGNQLDKKQIEFYFKIDGEEKLLGTFAIGPEGLYYYRPGSRVLTDKETRETLNTYDGFLSFENVKVLFEAIQEIGWSLKDEDDSKIAISVEEGVVLIKRE